jgi:uncharacterized protein YbjT (DUF2867 family)
VGINKKTVLLAGATGLVGNAVLQRCLADKSIAVVIVPTRRPVNIKHPKIRNIVMDLVAGENGEPAIGVSEAINKASAGKIDAYISALGTTIKTAGSREAFISVDRDLVCRFAEIAKQQNAQQVIFVSSVGATRQTSNFYLRVKGETEDLLERMKFKRVDILRPGVLLGPRSDSRPGEAIAQKLSFIYNPFLQGPLRRYRAIEADTVAATALALLRKKESGIFVHENTEMLELSE